METYKQEEPDLIVSRDEGLRCLEQRNYDDAVKALQEPALSDPSGESQALMGLAHYQREEYEQAAHYYEAALKLGPDRADWRDMLGRHLQRADIHAGMVGLDRQFEFKNCSVAQLPGAWPDGTGQRGKRLRTMGHRTDTGSRAAPVAGVRRGSQTGSLAGGHLPVRFST